MISFGIDSVRNKQVAISKNVIQIIRSGPLNSRVRNDR